jgi:hypothetical protein
VHADLVLRDNGRIGWAIRKESPRLAAEIEDFHKNWAAKQGVIEYRLSQYMKRVKELRIRDELDVLRERLQDLPEDSDEAVAFVEHYARLMRALSEL